MKTKIFFFSLLLGYFFSINLFAQAPDYFSSCHKELWKSLNLPQADLSIGGPGLLGNRPGYSAEVAQEMSKLGIFIWGQNFSFITDPKDILALDALEKDPIMFKGLYIPVDEALVKTLRSELEKNEKLSVEEFYPHLKNRKILWFVGEKQYEAPIERLEYLFDLKELPFESSQKIIIVDPIRQAHQVRLKELDIIRIRKTPASFWSFPYVRGALVFSDLENSISIKKVMKQLRSFYKKGYRIVYNKNHEAALEMLTNQARRGQPVSLNFFQDEEIKNEYRERFKHDRAFTVEFIDPEGKLLGGTIGHVTAGLLFGESVFYEKTIDYAKFALLGTADLAKKNGLTFMDLQMVTPFSRSMKGRYTSREEFYSLWQASPSIDTFDFPDEWVLP